MKPRRVLIVDDEPAVRKALEKALSRAGHTVHSAPSGEQACEILAAHTVDVILMDLRMPSMSGQTLYHVILSQWPHLACRVAVMSGDPDGDDGHDWLEIYRLPVISKPFELTRVFQMVEFLAAEERRQANGS
jgi:two-component system response regulator (stage 0 sporulation protein F)